MKEIPPPGRYLGDGVYATFDGWQIWLTAHRAAAAVSIALDPPTFLNLLGVAQDIGHLPVTEIA